MNYYTHIKEMSAYFNVVLLVTTNIFILFHYTIINTVPLSQPAVS